MTSSASNKDKKQPPYTFTFSASLSSWNRSPSECLARNRSSPTTTTNLTETGRDDTSLNWDGLATASLVFHPSLSPPKILILRRAPTDSLPLKWELPGGAVDPTDTTVLHAAARELFEETGLIAKHFSQVLSQGPPSGAQGGESRVEEVFSNRLKTTTFARYTFLVEVESCVEVRLDAEEHCEFAWVGEGEVRERRFSDAREVEFTKDSVARVCLEGFRRKKMGTGGKGVL